MQSEMRKSLNLILKQFSELDYVHPEDIPNIDLYVDQVTTFIESQLSSLKRDEDEKILTKTMINNYTKNHVLPSPDKKKYSKDHVLTLILIYYLKSFLSIKDIQTLLEPITDKYFGTESELSFYELYEELVAQGNGQSKALIKDVIAKYNAMQNAFSDAPEEDQEFLRNFGFICMLSFDVYIKKMMIETLIDFNSQQRKAAADQAKEKKDKS
ncbi:DUF1836 domain-containing protein [Roseburia sp. NSJ-9]|jgi:hypothetical protein|uniref:DUF1836 domain-containing protein n=1 Tax=Roseburia lenta TaxID=2763061 RepID=A0ABR7GJ09_9FIRM|nr:MULTISPECIES: DUF1836 domain-containing protein [Roseburia]MBC5687292.1 DUF1836 domain-containing protein [Roseburia lenta]RHO30983.1 DUF1836 domain-containing protein [Roseburia sp. AM16-25]